MDYAKLKGAITLLEELRSTGQLYQSVSAGDFSFDGNFEGVSDEAWDAAILAARKEMKRGVEKDYRQLVLNLENLGVTNVPPITSWPAPEKPY